MSQPRVFMLRSPPSYRRSIVRSLPSDEPWRQELDRDRDERLSHGGGQLVKEVLRWLLLAQRPLTLSELRQFVRFSFVSDGLRIRSPCLDDLESFLATSLPGTIEVRATPGLVAVPGHDGAIRWQTSLRQTAALRSPEIRQYLSNLPVSHVLYLQPRDMHYRIADICLRYLAQIPGIEQTSEQASMHLCAEHPPLRYVLDHWKDHVQLITSEPLLQTFTSSGIFRDAKIAGRMQTLLPYAARHGHLTLVHKLLTVANIHPDTREAGPESHTALTVASCNNHKEIVKLLLAHPILTLDLCVAGQRTALHLSLIFENFGITRLLLRRGASSTLAEAHGWAAASLLLRTTGTRRISHGLGCQKAVGGDRRSFASYQGELKQTVDVLLATKGSTDALVLTAQDIDMATENGNLLFVEQMLREHCGKLLIEEPPQSSCASEDGRRSPRSNRSEVWWHSDDEESDDASENQKDKEKLSIRRTLFAMRKRKKPICCNIM